MLWNENIRLEDVKQRSEVFMHHYLGIEFTELGPDFLIATMPVDDKTKQPAGLLHGGANVVLAESLGSVASYWSINQEKYYPVGIEINANHLRSVTNGKVKGICTNIHFGKFTHVWEIKIYDEENNLTCVSRFTIAIISKQP